MLSEGQQRARNAEADGAWQCLVVKGYPIESAQRGRAAVACDGLPHGLQASAEAPDRLVSYLATCASANVAEANGNALDGAPAPDGLRIFLASVVQLTSKAGVENMAT